MATGLSYLTDVLSELRSKMMKMLVSSSASTESCMGLNGRTRKRDYKSEEVGK